MKYIIILSFTMIYLNTKSQITGNWYFNSNTNLFETDIILAYKINLTPKDTSSLLTFDNHNNNLHYCPIYLNLQYGNTTEIYCTRNNFTDTKYLYFNDTIQMIFYNNCYELTISEIKNFSKQQLQSIWRIKNFVFQNRDTQQ